MRLAITLHAASSPSASSDARLLRERLSAGDSAFEAIDLPAYEDSATALPRILDRARAGSDVLIFVLAGFSSRGGSLEIQGAARSHSLFEINAALASSGAHAAMIVDGVLAPSDADPVDSLEALARTLSPERTKISQIVGLRRAGSREAGIATPLLALLDHAAADGRIHSLSSLAEALREQEDLATYAESFWCHLCPGSPTILAPRFPTQARTIEPSSLHEPRRVLSLARAEPRARADALVQMAATYSAGGDDREASFHLQKALAVDHRHRAALEASLVLATRSRSWDDVSALGNQLLSVLEANADRFLVTMKLARIWQDEARDEERATAALEAARVLSPRVAEVYERLIALYDRARRFVDLTATLEAYARLAPSPRERASRLEAAAQIAGSALADRPRALALYDKALALYPTDEALLRARRDLAESALAFACDPSLLPLRE